MCVKLKSITVEINLNLLNKYKGGNLNFIVTQPLQPFPMKKCFNYLKHFLLGQKSKKEKTFWVIINWKYSIFFIFSIWKRSLVTLWVYLMHSIHKTATISLNEHIFFSFKWYRGFDSPDQDERRHRRDGHAVSLLQLRIGGRDRGHGLYGNHHRPLHASARIKTLCTSNYQIKVFLKFELRGVV